MKKFKVIILLFVIIFDGCEKEETILYENLTKLDSQVLGFDLDNKIILYNGESTTIINGKIVIGDSVLNVETTDIELSIGKKYNTTIGGQVFRMFYTELPIVTITTDGAKIVDDPKVNGEIYLLVNGEKTLSSFQHSNSS